MSNKLHKMLEVFKLGLKSDAVPRAPRNTERTETPEAHNENVELPEEQEEEIIIESVSDDDLKKEKKPKKKSPKKSKKPKKIVDDDDDEEEFSKSSQEKRGSASSVNVQATGTVYNIVNAKDVRLGNDYYFGPVTKMADKAGRQKKYEEEEIEKDNWIRLLMEARIKPNHEFMDYISKNLGKNWHAVFIALGYKLGRIETAELNAKGTGYDITEARYKLLYEWVNNDDDGTLGRLATLLWEEGERSIVKDLSIMYKNCKK